MGGGGQGRLITRGTVALAPNQEGTETVQDGNGYGYNDEKCNGKYWGQSGVQIVPFVRVQRCSACSKNSARRKKEKQIKSPPDDAVHQIKILPRYVLVLHASRTPSRTRDRERERTAARGERTQDRPQPRRHLSHHPSQMLTNKKRPRTCETCGGRPVGG